MLKFQIMLFIVIFLLGGINPTGLMQLRAQDGEEREDIESPEDPALEEMPPEDEPPPRAPTRRSRRGRMRRGVEDPSTVPFRSLRRRRGRRSQPPSRRRRSGFNDPKVRLTPGGPKAPSIGTPPAPMPTQPDQKIVIAGPDYNKEHVGKVPKDLKPTLVENFDFHDADINDVINAISKLTKKNFILGQKLRGKVTIISPTPISVEDAWRAFLTALQINDLTTVESGAYIKVIRRTEARYSNIKTYSGEYSPDSEDIITRFISLKYIDAQEISQTLRDLVSRSGGRILAYERTNTVIITDSGSNIKRLLKIIKEMDVAGFEEKLDIIKVHYASASEIADKIAVITEKTDTGRRSRRSRRRSRFRRGDSGEGGSPAEFKGKIIADDKTNSLIVLATESNLKKLRRLLRKIDYATKTSAASNIHVHYLRNATAEEVAATLSGIASGGKGRKLGRSRNYTPGGRRGSSSSASTTAFSGSLFSGEIKINADKATNSLVIIASQQDYDSLKEIIHKLDLRRKQVYVEAIIAEVSISKGKSLGVSASKVDPTKGIYSFGDASLNSMQLINDPLSIFATGLAAGMMKGQKTITTANGDITVADFAIVLKALYGNSDINVLSTPQILTTDNEDAEITVGEKIPFLTGTNISTTGSQQSVARESVGVKLKITPQINETSEYVKLKLEQEANDVSNRTVEGMPANVGPATLERSTKTTVIVKDQEMVTIGGLIRDKITETTTKIPILGDVPLIGWLFRNKTSNVSKTNLIIFIKPTIISDYSDLRKLYHKQAEDRRKFVTKIYGEEDVHQKFIDERDMMRIDRKKNEGDEEEYEQVNTEEVEEEE